MKRITALLLALLLAAAFVGCDTVTKKIIRKDTGASSQVSSDESSDTSSDGTSQAQPSSSGEEKPSESEDQTVSEVEKQTVSFDGEREEESGYNLFYVDSENGDDENSGRSPEKAWKSLENVNDNEFEPGTKILLKRGSVFYEQLVPKSSGKPGKYIIIDSYGSGPKPIINGDGESAAVILSSLEYVEVRNLAVTNSSEYMSPRKGVSVVAGGQVSNGVYHKGGMFNHIYLINLDVYDVTSNEGDRFNGGIVFYSKRSENPAAFNEVLVQGCTVKNTGGCGIVMASDYANGPGVEWSPLAYYPSQNIAVRGNFVSHCASDGIFISATNNLMIEYNTVTDTSYAQGSYAGIWPHYSSNVVMQYNEAYDVKLVGGDGQGFDVDINCVNTVVQYNYSHDNEGGFILLCTDGINGGYNKDISVRYNVSQNDMGQIFTLSGPISDVKIYNNTVYTKSGLKTRLAGSYDWGAGASPADARFTNNIFYMNSNGYCSFIIPSRIVFDTNLFYGTYDFAQLNETGAHISGTVNADPLFKNAGGAGRGLESVFVYNLNASSPAVNSGKWISGCGGRDFAGNTVSRTGKPDLGAFEFVK